MDNKVLLEKWNGMIETSTEKTAPVTKNKGQLVQLLENQEQWCLTEGSSTADIAQYTPILVPAVRRIFPNLIANEIVSIQPMSTPTGYAYALRYSYGKLPAQSTVDRGKLNRDLSGASRNFVSIALVLDAVPGAGDITAPVAATVEYAEGNKILVRAASVADADTLKAAALVTIGGVDFNITLAMNNEAGFNLIFSNHAKVLSTVMGEVLGTPGNDFPEMKMALERMSIEAMTRKLKAEYTQELAQDLKNVHGLDAEAEMINILEYEMVAELDRELITAIRNKATLTEGWRYGTTGVGTVTADGRYETEKFRTLYTRIIKEANQIALTTRRGVGNIIICSMNVVSALETLNNFMYSSVPGELTNTLGIAKVGTLDGRFSVYVDTFAMTDYAVVAYKGSTIYDSGIIYAPYIPMQLQKVIDPITFQPKIAFMTRDAIVDNIWGSQNYYRMIPIDFAGSSLTPGYAFGM